MELSSHGLRRGARFSAVRSCVLAAGALCLLPTATRAESPSTQTVADAQCMVVGARLSASSDAQERVPGQMILMYYLGRIDGRSPHTDLKTLIENETQKMTAADLKNAAGRCSKEFSARGEQIVQIGKSLSKPGK